MSFKAGAITGELRLDTRQHDTALRTSVAGTQQASGQLRDSLARPFAPAVMEVNKLSSSMRMSAGVGAALGVGIVSAMGLAAGAIRSAIGSLADFAVAGIKAAASYEATLLSFETMLGSASKAAKLMDEIKQFAAETPFELPTLTDTTKKLLAYGVAQEDILDTMRRLGDIAAATGKPLGDFADIYGKVFSKGEMQLEEMNQLVERGVPIARTLADAYNVSTDEIMNMASEGRLGFDQLDFAISRLTEKGSMFGGGMEKLSQGMSGLWSTLKDEWADVERQFGLALVQGADGKSLIAELSAEIQEMKPAIVSAGLAAAEALKLIMPLIREAAEGLGNLRWLLSESEKSQGKSTRELPKVVESAKAAGVGGAGDVDQIAGGYQRAAEDLRQGLRGLSEATVMGMDAKGAEEARQWISETMDAAGRIQQLRKEVADAAAKNDVESYNRGLDALAEQIKRIEGIKDGLNDLPATFGNGPNSEWLRGLVDQARLSTNAGFKQSRDAWKALENRGQSQSPGETPATDEATPDMPPALNDPGVSKSKAKETSIDLKAMMRETQLLALESSDRVFEAERLRLANWLSDEQVKIKTIEDRHAVETLYLTRLADIEKREAADSADRQRRTMDVMAENRRKSEEKERADRERADQEERRRLEEIGGRAAGVRIGRGSAIAFSALAREAGSGASVSITSAANQFLPNRGGQPASGGISGGEGAVVAELKAMKADQKSLLDEVQLVARTSVARIEEAVSKGLIAEASF